MDIGQVESAINSRTKAILPVHLYGQTVDMDPLLDIAKRHGLYIIEDACQAHGAEYKGRRAGGLGDAAAFSFYFSKNLGAYGEGGMITTHDDEIARKVRMIRDHGSNVRYYHDLVGFNGRLDELQAVVLRAKLPHLETWNDLRRQHAETYQTLLAGLPLATPHECPENRHVYHLYVIQTQNRDELQAWLKERGVGTGIHYPVPVHLQASMDYLDYKPGDFPVTERVVSQILSLPMFAELTTEDVGYIAEGVKSFIK
jgi:dTDP-4-amino-4,6-dideoxygalactose transaminase